MRTFETIAIVLLGAELVISEGLSLSDLLWVPLSLWIILSITRKRSQLARTIFTALFGLGYILLLAALLAASGEELAEVKTNDWLLVLAFSLLAAFKFWLLWCSSTSRWLATRQKLQSDSNTRVR